MKFDRKKFYDGFRREFGEIKDYQAEGIERLLTGFETYYGWWNTVYKIANAFAQIAHETAHSFMPVQEGYYLAKGVKKDKNYFQGNYDRVQKFRKSLRYYPFDGKGDIQLTWDFNYIDQTTYIKRYFPEVVADFESRTGQEFDLYKYPKQMFDGSISFCVVTIGMNRGTFTGKSFSNYRKDDYFNMRSIVNGDKNKIPKGASISLGKQLEAASRKFEKILIASLEKEPENILEDIADEEIDDLLEVPVIEKDSSDDTHDLPPQINPQNPAPPEQTDSPVETTVKKETETPEGTTSLEITTQAGDTPEAEPKVWFSVEDWKPFVFRWIKRIWTAVSGANVAQALAFVKAASSDPPNWFIYLCIGLGIFILTLIIAVVISGVLLLIWYFNRREIKEAKQLEHKSKVDPNSFNLGLIFEKL